MKINPRISALAVQQIAAEERMKTNPRISSLAVQQIAAEERMKTNPRGWRAAMEAEGGLGGDKPSQGGCAANVMLQSSCPSSPPMFFWFGPYTTWLIGGVAFGLGLLVGYIWNSLLSEKQLEVKFIENKNGMTAAAPTPQQAEPALLPKKETAPATSAAASPIEEAYEIIETVETSCTDDKSKNNVAAATAKPTATTATSSVTVFSGLGVLGTSENSELEITGGEATCSNAIVMAVARKLSSLDFNQMSIQEQLLALELMLRVDHTQHAKRLGTEANKIQSDRLDVAKHTAAHVLAKDAVTLARERTEELKKTCSDSMMTGIVFMAVVGGYQAWQRGVFTPLFHRCGSLPRASSWGGPFGLLGAYKSAEVAVCYASSLSDTLLGIFVLAAVPYVVYRTGLLHDYHRMPIAKLFIGLGLVCGTAGHVAISKVGGDGRTWFVLWQFWTLLHVIMSTTAFRMCQRDVTVALHQIGAEGSAVSAEKIYRLHTGGLNVGIGIGIGGGASEGGTKKVLWIAAGMWLLSGVVLPYLMATVPFIAAS
ncbi:hypothetical protein Ndes2437A_g04564 [Nannochloris sp. 'desiccata']|nr:hypothetical protein KSW81_004360 [Chlorella desiccata (nom. nud.)]